MANDRPFGSRMQLYSQTGYNLTIKNTGEISGTQVDGDLDSHIEVCSGDAVSQVRLLGMNSNLYICFRDKGELYGESDPSNPGTIFIEELQGSYKAYKSALYPEWYIGINNCGLPQDGCKTKYGEEAVKFLKRRL